MAETGRRAPQASLALSAPVAVSVGREPDIFYLSKGRPDKVTAQYVSAPAELVIEVLSEGSRTRRVLLPARFCSGAGRGQAEKGRPVRRPAGDRQAGARPGGKSPRPSGFSRAAR